MLRIDHTLTPEALLPRVERVFELSAGKIRAIADDFESAPGSPVFTVQGSYVGRDWTEWTEGFHYGSALLQYDATGEEWFLDWGRRKTVERATDLRESAEMHREIYRAIRAHKPADAPRLMEQHLRMAQAAQGMEQPTARRATTAAPTRENRSSHSTPLRSRRVGELAQ